MFGKNILEKKTKRFPKQSYSTFFHSIPFSFRILHDICWLNFLNLLISISLMNSFCRYWCKPEVTRFVLEFWVYESSSSFWRIWKKNTWYFYPRRSPSLASCLKMWSPLLNLLHKILSRKWSLWVVKAFGSTCKAQFKWMWVQCHFFSYHQSEFH